MQLENKNILVGITGGVAAYKICELIRMYKRAGANVKVVLTKAGLDFVTPLTISTLSQNAAITDNIDWQNYRPEHISLTDWSDVFVIAPASANTIAKITHGICDNLLTTTYSAFKKPIIVAPTMNCNMWDNDVVQENIAKLRAKHTILDPEIGFLACGDKGAGRLCVIEKIFDKTVEILQPTKLQGKKVLITAGGTREKIDPVRYISNFSSGKMGQALAKTAFEMGADVTLVTTVSVNAPYKTINVDTAKQMQEAVEQNFDNSDIVIMSAAVADYRVEDEAEQKIKKTNDDNIQINLVKNPDILQEICVKRTHQRIVGFCAESENLIENAKTKISKKGCDYIVANDISRCDIGFSADENEVYLINKNLDVNHFEKAPKTIIARKILEAICE